MEIKSKLKGRIITRWSRDSFAQEKPDVGSRIDLSRDSLGDMRVTVKTSAGAVATSYLTPEAIDWLNGQEEPPQEPLARGMKIKGAGGAVYEVVEVSGQQVCCKTSKGNLHLFAFHVADAWERVG